MITGASNVSNAMGCGKQAAMNIDERLMDESRWEKLFPAFEYGGQAPPEPRLSRRHSATPMPASARVHSKEEVVAGLSRAGSFGRVPPLPALRSPQHGNRQVSNRNGKGAPTCRAKPFRSASMAN